MRTTRTSNTYTSTACTRSSTRLLGLTAGLALTLTACGGTESTPAGSAQAGAVASPQVVDGISTVRNDADITFVNDMYPHHQGALAMAELAATRAQNSQVKDLAVRIAAAQDPELTRMRTMASVWGTEIRAAAGHGGGHSGGTAGGDDAAKLEKLSGAAFDREFLTLMTAHHQGAVQMARTELGAGSNPQAKQLAQEIIDAQQAEITEMTKLSKEL